MDPKIIGPVDNQLAAAAASVTKTASFNGTAVDLGNGYAPGGNGQPFQLPIPVPAADFASGDESYKFTMQHSDDNSTFVDCGAQYSVVAGDVGGSAVLNGTVSKRYVRYSLVIAGTTPSITYGPAYLVPREVA